MSTRNRTLVEVAVLTGLPKILTYHLPDKLMRNHIVGRRAIVPVGRQKQLGIIVREGGSFDGPTKPVFDLPDSEPVISDELMQLSQFISEYYFASPGEVLSAILPSALSGRTRQNFWVTDRDGLKQAASDGNDLATRLLKVLGRKRKLDAAVLYQANIPADDQLLAEFGEMRWDVSQAEDETDYDKPASKSELLPPAGAGEQASGVRLNPAQSDAVAEISSGLRNGGFQTFLLHGVTGSGKTEVYLEVIKQVVSDGGQALIIVPEIGLSQALHARLKSTFGDKLGLLHSRLSMTERLSVWQRSRSGDLRLILGARSAVLSDLPDLRLIVVDEEHDQSLKQDSPAPRYHSRDVAIVRGKLKQVPVVLGSATPSAESYYNATTGKYRLLELPERIDSRAMPTAAIIDRRDQFQRGDYSHLSKELLSGIAEALEKNEQIMVLLNRRGFAPSVRCYDCGEKLSCRNCDVTLVYHKSAHKVVCHTCGYQERYPEHCPECHSSLFLYSGIGTERLEEELRTHFPEAGIVRMDLDSTRRKGSFDTIFKKFNSGDAQILLGTQMISKGFDFPQVSLVGVVSADTALEFPDFRAREKTFQLLTQVAGRAGRGKVAGKVLLQTLNPNEAAIEFAARHDFRGFFDSEIAERRELNFPPFCHLILLSIEATALSLGSERAQLLAQRLNSVKRAQYRVLGPVPAPLAKRKKVYRFHLLIKTERVKSTLAVLNHILQAKEFQHNRRFRVIVDVDAVDML